MGNVKVKWEAVDGRRQDCVAHPKQRDGRDKASSRSMVATERPVTPGWTALKEQEVLQTAHAEDIEKWVVEEES